MPLSNTRVNIRGTLPTRKSLDRLLCQANASIRAHREGSALFLAIIAYSVILSYLTVARMHALHSSAWDLGNYNQAMYTFIHNGKLFYWTSDLPQNPGGSLFGSHFSLILAIIAPAYLLYPGPETLLVIQSLIIGLGAVPVWLLAKNIAGVSSPGLRLTLVAIYLLQPALLGLNWFDFHPEAFIPTLYLFAAYYLMRRNFSLGIGFSSLLLSTIEYAALMLLTLSLTLAFVDTRGLLRNQDPKLVLRKLAPWAGLTCLSLAWLYLSISVIRLFNPQDPTTSGITANWTVLGANNLLQVPMVAGLNPGRAIQALFTDGTTKFYYLTIMSLPFALLPLLSPRFWILSAPWLPPALLSNTSGYYTMGLQYTAFIFPPLVLSFVNQLRSPWLQSNGPAARFWTRAMSSLKGLKRPLSRIDLRVLLLASTIIALALSNPVNSFLVATSPWANYGLPYSSEKSVAADRLLALIPSGASVLTDYYIFPLVSSRINAFTWPSVIDYPTVPFVQYIQQLAMKSDYVLLDTTSFLPYNAVILSFAENRFGVLGYSNSLLLLERNYSGEPVLFDPYQQVFSYRQLRIQSGGVASDPLSTFGKILTRDGNETIDDFWTGPGVILPPGEYTVDFRLRLNRVATGHILNLRTSSHVLFVEYELMTVGKAVFQVLNTLKPRASNQTISNTDVNSTLLPVGTYQDIVQNIRIDSFSLIGFPGENVSAGSLSLDRIQVKETEPLSYYANVTLQYQNGTTLPLKSVGSSSSPYAISTAPETPLLSQTLPMSVSSIGECLCPIARKTCEPPPR